MLPVSLSVRQIAERAGNFLSEWKTDGDVEYRVQMSENPSFSEDFQRFSTRDEAWLYFVARKVVDSTPYELNILSLWLLDAVGGI